MINPSIRPTTLITVMSGLMPGIPVLLGQACKDMDGRDDQREDALRAFARP
jgi:hypothetical protein